MPPPVRTITAVHGWDTISLDADIDGVRHRIQAPLRKLIKNLATDLHFGALEDLIGVQLVAMPLSSSRWHYCPKCPKPKIGDVERTASIS